MESEKSVEQYLCRRITKMGGRAYKFVSPGNVGVPDRMIVLPYGRIFFVELKTDTGRLSKLQLLQKDRLSDLGCAVFVAYGRAGVDEVLGVIGAHNG